MCAYRPWTRKGYTHQVICHTTFWSFPAHVSCTASQKCMQSMLDKKQMGLDIRVREYREASRLLCRAILETRRRRLFTWVIPYCLLSDELHLPMQNLWNIWENNHSSLDREECGQQLLLHLVFRPQNDHRCIWFVDIVLLLVCTGFLLSQACLHFVYSVR